MKRIFACLLCILLFPLFVTTAEAEETDLTEPPSAGQRDPNWVPWVENEEPVEAFAAGGQTIAVFHGMRPLSRYAQALEVPEEDLILAARVAFLEAGGRNERAYRAVLCVLFNRCVATRFGGKVTDIPTEAYRKGQFSVIHHKQFKTLTPPQAIVDAARDIFVDGNLDLPENILFFCAERLGTGWGGRKFYKNIGGNLFFYGRTE